MSFADYLTPSGEGIATDRNEERANWAEEAVLAFRETCGGDMDETALYDLVANLGHLADRLTAHYADFELSFDEMLRLARVHYEGERGEGDGFA